MLTVSVNVPSTGVWCPEVCLVLSVVAHPASRNRSDGGGYIPRYLGYRMGGWRARCHRL